MPAAREWLHKSRFLFLIASLLLIIGIGNYIFITQEHKVILEESLHELEVASRLTGAQLLNWEHSKRYEVRQFIEERRVASYLSAMLNGDIASIEFKERLADFMIKRSFNNFFLIDNKDSTIYNYSNDDKNFKLPSWELIPSLATDRVLLHQPYWCEEHHTFHSLVEFQLYNPDGLMTGRVLFRNQHSSRVYPILTSYPNKSKSGKIMLLLKDSDVWYFISIYTSGGVKVTEYSTNEAKRLIAAAYSPESRDINPKRELVSLDYGGEKRYAFVLNGK